MRHDSSGLEPEINDLSAWVQWMEQELTLGGPDLPGTETCLLFAAAAIRLACNVRRVYGHLPASLRVRLIEASILHQCWQRQRELAKRSTPKIARLTSLPMLEAREFTCSGDNGHKVVVAADEHEYAIRIPTPERKWDLATEVICFEIARWLGLPTPPLALIVLTGSLAARVGVLIHPSGCPVKRSVTAEALHCLGVRKIATVPTSQGRPSRPLSARGRALLLGQAMIEMLTWSTLLEEPSFICPKNYAEPVFLDYSHCLAESNWPRFITEQASPCLMRASVTRLVRSYQQLEAWIARAERLDFCRIAEIIVKLPSEWYGNRPLLLAKVMEKVRDRVHELRPTVLRLIDAGAFPRIGRLPEDQAEALVSLEL